MIAKRHLPNAPIKEAIIDIQITRSGDFDPKCLEAIHEEIIANYPHKDVIHHGVFGFQMKQNAAMSTTMDQKTLGYKFSSEDKKNIVQFKDTGFTFSRLEPYETWESMSNEAKRLWEIYKHHCDNCIVKRVATRYINLMRIPLTFNKFEEYLTAPPVVPEALPQGISSFITRVVIANPTIEASGIVTQALDTIEQEFAPITLDIDVVKTGEFDINSDVYWNILESLRDFKNDIFFESITETTAELFQ